MICETFCCYTLLGVGCALLGVVGCWVFSIISGWGIMIATLIGAIADADIISQIFTSVCVKVAGELSGFAACRACVPAFGARVTLKDKPRILQLIIHGSNRSNVSNRVRLVRTVRPLATS